MEYRPCYPEKSNGDFNVSQDVTGKISVYGNFDALIPTINHYNNICEFEAKL